MCYEFHFVTTLCVINSILQQIADSGKWSDLPKAAEVARDKDKICIVYSFIEWTCSRMTMHSNNEEYLCHFQYWAIFNSSVKVILYLVNFGTWFYFIYTMEQNCWGKCLLYLVLVDLAKQFAKVSIPIYSPTKNVWAWFVPIPTSAWHLNLLYMYFTEYELVSVLGFHCGFFLSLVTNEFEHIF